MAITACSQGSRPRTASISSRTALAPLSLAVTPPLPPLALLVLVLVLLVRPDTHHMAYTSTPTPQARDLDSAEKHSLRKDDGTAHDISLVPDERTSGGDKLDRGGDGDDGDEVDGVFGKQGGEGTVNYRTYVETLLPPSLPPSLPSFSLSPSSELHT